jgi:hypothetical protein
MAPTGQSSRQNRATDNRQGPPGGLDTPANPKSVK